MHNHLIYVQQHPLFLWKCDFLESVFNAARYLLCVLKSLIQQTSIEKTLLTCLNNVLYQLLVDSNVDEDEIAESTLMQTKSKFAHNFASIDGICFIAVLYIVASDIVCKTNACSKKSYFFALVFVRFSLLCLY